MSWLLLALACLFGVNGQVIMANSADLPDAGVTSSGSASEAGGTSEAGGKGNGGAGNGNDGISTDSGGREAMEAQGDMDFYSKDIDDKITKIRPMATPVDQISRFADAKKATSFEVKYYSIGTRPIKTKVKVGTEESTGTSMVLQVEDPTMFTLDDTIRVVGVKAVTNYKGQAYADLKAKNSKLVIPDLVLCVCGRDDNGMPIVYAVNGNDVNGQPLGIPQLSAGQVLIRMAKSCGELDVQTGRFNNLPTGEMQYCQNFMIQVEMSTFDKIADKVVNWDFSDLEEDSIYDMRLAMENSLMFGDMGSSRDKGQYGAVVHEGYLVDGRQGRADRTQGNGGRPEGRLRQERLCDLGQRACGPLEGPVCRNRYRQQAQGGHCRIRRGKRIVKDPL